MRHNLNTPEPSDKAIGRKLQEIRGNAQEIGKELGLGDGLAEHLKAELPALAREAVLNDEKLARARETLEMSRKVAQALGLVGQFDNQTTFFGPEHQTALEYLVNTDGIQISFGKGSPPSTPSVLFIEADESPPGGVLSNYAPGAQTAGNTLDLTIQHLRKLGHDVIGLLQREDGLGIIYHRPAS